jgi:DNA polymerase-4
MESVFLHCDMNNYYASVECIYNENLRRVPMAVVGDPAMRHGIILAKNELAKSKGVITGESIYSAKQKVPNLTTILADHPKYLYFSRMSRKLFREYSDEVIPYGLDEAWLNLSGIAKNIEEGVQIANEIKERIKLRLHLTASIGVSYNYIFSKLGSDLAKADSLTVLPKEDLKTVIWNRPAFELLFVGKVARRKLTDMGILTIGDLANHDIRNIRHKLGKSGELLWWFANGDDRGFDPKTPENQPFKSIGNSTTMPFDLSDDIDILTMFYVLSKTVSARLNKHKLKGDCISILIKYSDFTTINRQMTIETATDKEIDIYKIARRLFLSNFDKRPVRSVGVHVSKLHNNQHEQLTLFEREPESITEIDEIERNLNGKLKQLRVERIFDFGFSR